MAIPFVYVRAHGSYREIGRQVGEAARSADRGLHRLLCRQLRRDERRPVVRRSRSDRPPPTCATPAPTRPSSVEELEGMAEGAGVPLLPCSCPTAARSSPSSEPTVAASPAAPPRRTQRVHGAPAPRVAPRRRTAVDAVAVRPARRRSQHGLVRRRRGEQRALRPDGARRHQAAGLRRRRPTCRSWA